MMMILQIFNNVFQFIVSYFIPFCTFTECYMSDCLSV